ncbi:peptidoglycan DD-metalloendopeptidase family protein [Enterococcus plantarum]|uniref:murein hydrolase activator EnvC family protein n=1 Tax=Enterococcus plantarum TaxID=1077675 RepID=UPI001A8F3D75|nr:peptidoglycan DD-metalloendopeptidase family protein [Enterococcus plantarum]MBO0466728.1 peptidoglycan DD-metalloendopeptidase family protein [Enterococcus plantarum]
MKKKLLVTLSFMLLVSTAPMTVLADDIDQKIENQTKKIEDIIKNEKDAKEYLSSLENEITIIETEYQKVLSEKQKHEKEMNKLNKDIANLETKIKKRNQQLQAQARTTQTNHEQESMLTVLLSAESISDAISKALAVNTLVTANNDILTAQKQDKKELDTLKISLTETLKTLEKKTAELEEKEAALAEAKLEQNVKINEIAASLASEKAEKDKFVKQKEEAIKRKEAQLKAITEEKKKEAEAKAIAEKQAKEQAKVKQAAPTQTAEQEKVVSLPETDTSNNDVPENSQQAPTPPVSSGGWSAPVANLTVTSGFGGREDPTGISGSFHDGIDFGGASGTPIMAARSGEVVSANYGGMAGNHVVIKHDNGYYSYYLHMSSLTVSAGQSVSAGQNLGGMGTTGNSTGVHLHFSISTGLWSGFVNPAPFLGL